MLFSLNGVYETFYYAQNQEYKKILHTIKLHHVCDAQSVFEVHNILEAYEVA